MSSPEMRRSPLNLDMVFISVLNHNFSHVSFKTIILNTFQSFIAVACGYEFTL